MKGTWSGLSEHVEEHCFPTWNTEVEALCSAMICDSIFLKEARKTLDEQIWERDASSAAEIRRILKVLSWGAEK